MINDSEATVLASSPHLGGLTALDLTDNRIGFAGARLLIEKLVGYPAIEVGFGSNRLGPEAAALAHCTALAARSALLVGDNRIGDTATAALLLSPYLHGLCRIDLSRNEIGEQAVAALVAESRPNLTALTLEGNGLGNHEARVLVGTDSLVGMNALSLRGNHIGDPGAVALAGACVLAQLQRLNLAVNRIGDGGALALAHSTTLAGLRTLDLSGNRIGDAGALAFLERRPVALEELNLTNNRISPDTVRAIRSATREGPFRVQLGPGGFFAGTDPVEHGTVFSEWDYFDEVEIFDE